MYLISNWLILTILNACICILGDYLVEWNQNSQLVKAICDNITHAAIGLISAAILISQTNHRSTGIERIGLIGLSVLLSSVIDVDHFVVAKSFKLSVIMTNAIFNSNYCSNSSFIRFRFYFFL